MKTLEEQQLIREKHQFKLQNSKRIRRQRIDVEMSGSIQVAVKGSRFFFERVAVMYTPLTKQYFFVSYNKELPDGLFLLAPDMGGGDYLIKEIKECVAEIIVDSFEFTEKYKHFHVNSYTTLLTYCLMNGIDLVKEGLVSI